jgi:hypothetical protein
MSSTSQSARPIPDAGASPPVDPRTVEGRRRLHFTSLEEVVADAEQLIASPTARTLGNWPISQLLTHLAGAMNRSIDGIAFRAPWYVRLYGMFVKRRVLERGLSPGFKLPREREALAYPAAASPEAALDILRKAVSRMGNEPATATHPLLGKLTHEEWTQFHLRHAELHLSFALPS